MYTHISLNVCIAENTQSSTAQSLKLCLSMLALLRIRRAAQLNPSSCACAHCVTIKEDPSVITSGCPK